MAEKELSQVTVKVPRELLEAHREAVIRSGVYTCLEEAVVDALKRQVEEQGSPRHLDTWSFRLGVKLGIWAALQESMRRLEADPERSAEKLAEWFKEKLEEITPQLAQPITESL